MRRAASCVGSASLRWGGLVARVSLFGVVSGYSPVAPATHSTGEAGRELCRIGFASLRRVRGQPTEFSPVGPMSGTRCSHPPRIRPARRVASCVGLPPLRPGCSRPPRSHRSVPCRVLALAPATRPIGETGSELVSALSGSRGVRLAECRFGRGEPAGRGCSSTCGYLLPVHSQFSRGGSRGSGRRIGSCRVRPARINCPDPSSQPSAALHSLASAVVRRSGHLLATYQRLLR